MSSLQSRIVSIWKMSAVYSVQRLIARDVLRSRIFLLYVYGRPGDCLSSLSSSRSGECGWDSRGKGEGGYEWRSGNRCGTDLTEGVISLPSRK